MSFEKSKNKYPLNFSLFPVGAASNSDDNQSVFSSSLNYSSGGVGNGNSSENFGHYQMAPNKPSVEKGLSLLRKIKIQDDLNISSSTAVAGNNSRYFGGDHVDSFELPSPIENLPSNPLDIQLSSLSTSAAPGSSGYTSGLYNSNEYFEQSSKYVSDPSVLLHNDKYKKVKFHCDTDSLTTATTNLLRNHQKVVHEPIAVPSRSCENWVPSEMKVNLPRENSSFLEKDLMWSSEIMDIFSAASDSAYLIPDDTKLPRASVSEESYRDSGLMNPEKNNSLQSMLNIIPRFQSSLNISNVKKSIQGRFEVICKFCVTNKEPHEECKHQLKDEFGLITCPVLYTYICDICGSTGSYAHTRKHCPMKEDYLAPPNSNAKAPFKKWRNGIVTLK